MQEFAALYNNITPLQGRKTIAGAPPSVTGGISPTPRGTGTATSMDSLGSSSMKATLTQGAGSGAVTPSPADGGSRLGRTLSVRAPCPFVISFYDAFVDSAEGTINFVMEYMDLGSLQVRL